MLRIRDFLTGGGYPFAKNPDKAKGDAASRDATLSKGDDNSKNVMLSKGDAGSKNDSGSKNVDTSKNDVNSNDVNSNSANIPNNDAVNNNVKDDNATNDSTDVKKSKVAVYKSAQSTKEVSKEDKAAADYTNNVEKKSEIKKDEDGRYDFSGDTNITNPFPEVITPKEVEEFQKEPVDYRPMPSIFKTFYTPAGKQFSVSGGTAHDFTIQLENAGYHYYDKDFVGRIDSFIFIPQVENDSIDTGEAEIATLHSSRDPNNDDGSIKLDISKATSTTVPYTLEVNGIAFGSDLNSETKIKFNVRKNQTFLHIIYYANKNDEVIYGYNRLNIDGSSQTSPWITAIPLSGAQFHFVDDLQYRKAASIEGNGELPQRSFDESGKFSTKPFKKLDLTDLHDSKNVSNVMFGYNAVCSSFTPLLRYDGEVDKDSVKRPTMDDLKNTNIPGYLYYSNDIDTPKGGTFTKENTKNFGNYDYGIVRDKDDNQVTTKHYYVTFRPIPTQLVVQYKDLKNNIESGKKYAIYSGNTLVSDTLTSSSNTPTAPTKADLQTMITNSNTTLLSEAAGYLSNGFAYLAPGNYIVKPTAAIDDDNYEWVVDSTDIANSSTSANVNIAVNKSDTDSTQQVVTFVLRRKIATVTFFDGDDSKPYAIVKVQKGSSIDGDELKTQSMPKDPTKSGFTFNGWFTGKDGKGTKFTGATPVSGDMSVYGSYAPKPPTPPTPPTPPEPEPNPTSEPEPDIDWDDIPDIDLTPDKEPTPLPVPDFPVPVAPAPILPPSEAESEPAPAPSQPEQPKQQAKHVAKHLPKTGSTATPILASAIASLFAGLAGLAESFAANRKRRN